MNISVDLRCQRWNVVCTTLSVGDTDIIMISSSSMNCCTSGRLGRTNNARSAHRIRALCRVMGDVSKTSFVNILSILDELPSLMNLPASILSM